MFFFKLKCPKCGSEMIPVKIVNDIRYTTIVYKCEKCGHVLEYKYEKRPLRVTDPYLRTVEGLYLATRYFVRALSSF